MILPKRTMIGFVIRAATQLRYWVAGSALFGGSVAVNKYEEWKSSLPDLKGWIDEFFPDTTIGALQATLKDVLKPCFLLLVVFCFAFCCIMDLRSRRAVEYGKSAGEALDPDKLLLADDPNQLAESQDTVIEDRRKQQEEEQKQRIESMAVRRRREQEAELEKLQDELLNMQAEYQREIDGLKRENKELRRAYLLRADKEAYSKKKRKIKESLIDMYSRVLDSLQHYDSTYSVADNLPRVVVVGDQSSGKTSVLEMIAQARIFPRGAGEMMTRSPVKVTLSEGPYHLAQFRDSSNEFDLTKADQLELLRNEIEARMRASVRDSGKTVSSETISLTVKGPKLPRMVLVDLPGVISTVTSEMARETKDDIRDMIKAHMKNPNAIILCIQDGSVDAERSNVTDLVSSMDPDGKRTIMVLTKVDMAEQNLANPDRIRKILDGRLFPMKALGYYAVVTGRGNSEDSIPTIQDYEQEFFATSKLFRNGILKPSQMTTGNMSSAVSECFWKMVRESIEQQTDAFRAARYNLETEWKNTFPRLRQLDRDELFERARGEILDEIVNLSQTMSADEWNRLLEKRLWEKVAPYVFENIYVPATLVETAGNFNTIADIRLKHWTERDLPQKSIQTGWEALQQEFQAQVIKFTSSAGGGSSSGTASSSSTNAAAAAKSSTANSRRNGRSTSSASSVSSGDDRELFGPLKSSIFDEAVQTHEWDPKAADYLRVIQQGALEDRMVPDRTAWERTSRFMEEAVKERLKTTEKALDEMRGPGPWTQWFRWTKQTEDQRMRRAAEKELRRILLTNPDHKPSLTGEDLIVVRKNLQQSEAAEAVASGSPTMPTTVPDRLIQQTWHQLYREHFLRRAIQTAYECRSAYFHYRQGFGESEVDCQVIPLFYRIARMLEQTSTALRQQITNTEQRRLEKEIRDVLEDWAGDDDVKREKLNGRRVDLAEELKVVRGIQEQLEEFVDAMKTQRS